MNTAIKLIICAAILSAPLHLCHAEAPAAETYLKYNIKTRQIIDKDNGPQKIEDQTAEIIVGLGNNYFYTVDKDGKTIYDFTKKILIRLDDKKRTYDQISLFSNVGFRGIEFQNRVFLAGIIRQTKNDTANTEDAPFNTFDLETNFSLCLPGSTPQKITETKQETEHTYAFSGKTIVECDFSDQAINEKDRPMFEKFLLYTCCLHPQIRESIVSANRIPSVIKYNYSDFGQTQVNMRLEPIKNIPQPGCAIPAGYTEPKNNPDGLAQIIRKVNAIKNPVEKLDKKDFIRIAEDSLAKNDCLNAMLATLEYNLQTSQSTNEEMARIFPAGKTDKRLETFIDNMAAGDKDTAEKSIKALESIDRKGLTRAHVIDIMIADAKMQTGDLEGAKKLFIKVLEINPYIAGVYKDLGDLYNQSFDTVSAWKCWDTARQLYPTHKMLEQITQYEKWLMDNFPEFF